MAALFALLVVLACGIVAWLGAASGGGTFFGIVLPYLAAAVFLAGVVLRVLSWARRPVPFCIPTTGGQQKSLPWIAASPLDNPSGTWGVVGRMVLEVLTFRSLFRNTALRLDRTGPKVAYSSAKSLWLFALLFHYALLVILIRHLRFFFEPVPWCVRAVGFCDSLFEVGLPVLYVSDVLFLAALLYLLGRRLFDGRIMYISLAQDYFPLFLLLGIAGSGLWMRYLDKVDAVAVKELVMGLVTFHPALPSHPLAPSFFVHLTLVCVLGLYFPFSKLMHLAGVFLSPTRVVPNMSRRARWVNPWNDPSITPHPYAAYEDEFREKMLEAGLPVEKKA